MYQPCGKTKSDYDQIQQLVLISPGSFASRPGIERRPDNNQQDSRSSTSIAVLQEQQAQTLVGLAE
jgi:hypothetical protein